MRIVFLWFFCSTVFFAHAQELIDGKYYDNSLEFFIVEENVRRTGVLDICIVGEDRRCIENLFTGFEVLVYNSAGKEIWASIWSGQTMRIKFTKGLPEAAHVVVRARAPYVVNKLTTTRIYQDKPLELKYYL
jgi:hypothetical protein